LGAHDSFREDNLRTYTNKFFSVKRPDHTGQPAGELGASEIRTGQPSRRPAAPHSHRHAELQTPGHSYPRRAKVWVPGPAVAQSLRVELHAFPDTPYAARPYVA
jgi:hypothetical protein